MNQFRMANRKWMGSAVVALALLTAPVVSQAGLVGHWTLDNGSTGAGGGLTNLGTDGTTSDLGVFGASPTFVPSGGFDGGGYATFDGTTQALSAIAAGNAADDLTDYPFSFAAWIRPTGTIGPPAAPARGSLFSVGLNTATNRYYAFEMGYGDATNSGDLEINRRNTAFTEGQVNANNSYATLTDGNWHHVAVVLASATVATMYIDGVEVSSTTPVTPNSVAFTDLNMIAIGALARSGAAPVDAWKGDIDDVRLYNHALDAGEVAALVPEPNGLFIAILGYSLVGFVRHQKGRRKRLGPC